MARFFTLAALASLLSFASAQTSTTCDPTKQTCPDDPAMGPTFNTDFTKASGVPTGWTQVNQGNINYNSQGANIILAKQGDSPTLQSSAYYLFGSFEAVVKAAPGQGIVTSIVMLSDDLDEVDWELLGGNTGQVQSNYFGKGDTSTYDRAAWHAVSAPQTTTHAYKVDWTPASVVWSIDGNVVRTLNYADAQGGSRFPQTPMRIRIGIWAGGDPSNGDGTVGWAGGLTDYSKAPFTMYLQSVTVTNYSPGKSYHFQDTSGSYQKISIDGGSVMSNANGKATASTTSSMTTSISIASAVPTIPLNATKPSNMTIAASTPTDKPVGAGSSSSSAAGSKQTGNSAAHVDAISIGGLTAFMAIAMALFA